MQPEVTQINIHPLKSASPVRLQQCKITPRGLEHDRRWMVVDGTGQGLTAREYPALFKIVPAVAEEGIKLAAGGMAELVVETPAQDARKLGVRVFASAFQATTVSCQADRWMTDYLGIPCRLVCMRDEDLRPVSESANGRKGDMVSFADQHPLLLIGEPSLEALNSRLDYPVSMRNFRPNLVVGGTGAFAEDEWSTIRIGECEFRVAQACTRCKMTTIDPVMAKVREDKEPLRTLARFRRNPNGNGLIFGVHLVPLDHSGAVSIGDRIKVRKSVEPVGAA